MKKLIALMVASAASLAFLAPTTAEANNCNSRAISPYGVHTSYQPVRLPCGNIVYRRVATPNHYRHVSPRPYVSRRHYGFANQRRFISRNHGFASRGSGISIRYSSGRGYCR